MNRALLTFLAVLMGTGAAATAQADVIDTIVVSEMKRQHSPAVGITVVKAGRVLKAKGYGLANVEHRAPATPGTFFQTASVGKQFTATLVMLLVRDGTLTLDDPVSRHLSGAPPSWRGITVRHLLTHTSGLPRTDIAVDLRKDYSEQELLSSAYRMPVTAAPGTSHAYSNLGYQVLGILCSRVGGKFWGEQLRERVFVRIRMQSRVISERDVIPARAAGYERFNGELENQPWVAPSLNTTGDGSLYVSARDMAQWALALQDQRLLSDAEKETMWTPATLADGQRANDGFGWKVFTDAGHRLVRHRGHWQGFTTHIVHLPEDRLTISVLMNRSNAEPHVIADRIAAHHIPALRKLPVVAPSTAALARTSLHVLVDINDRMNAVALVEVEPRLLQARLTLQAGMQQFQIGDADANAVRLGARFDEALVQPGKPQRLAFRGDDLFLEVAKPGDYTFQLDLRGHQAPVLTVHAPPN